MLFKFFVGDVAGTDVQEDAGFVGIVVRVF